MEHERRRTRGNGPLPDWAADWDRPTPEQVVKAALARLDRQIAATLKRIRFVVATHEAA